MNVFIEHEGEIFEFIPERCHNCPDVCELYGTEICKKYARGQSRDAICHQLYYYINEEPGAGHFKRIT